jgi:hypothetical protein
MFTIEIKANGNPFQARSDMLVLKVDFIETIFSNILPKPIFPYQIFLTEFPLLNLLHQNLLIETDCIAGLHYVYDHFFWD